MVKIVTRVYLTIGHSCCGFHDAILCSLDKYEEVWISGLLADLIDNFIRVLEVVDLILEGVWLL